MADQTYVGYANGTEHRIVVEYDENDNVTVTRDVLEKLLADQTRPYFPIEYPDQPQRPADD